MEFNYQLKLSKRRKTVAIKVQPSGVSVYAPHTICKNWLNTWLLSKQQWVLDKQQSLDNTRQTDIWSSNTIMVYGREYELMQGMAESYIDHKQNKVHLKSNGLICKETANVELKLLFSDALTEYLLFKLPQYCTKMNADFKTLKVRFYKRKWGSLSSNGTIAFNCTLLGAPKWVIDYVIVHELAHYHVMAHNQTFWSIVSCHYPDFKDAKIYLKKYGEILTTW
ncbi:M48 family metallopeptidase [Pseudoalteromonas luteoviolacea]|uniref:YgjP-like metallopeptidase domain-containing protein n=1 Tax=Pseudoalteromonas luteoviolacea DSM 6061 TaxID=1365250 RepID=A0A161XVK8_9GAMM|nr:M48 family metallopeptidase [Pseudoalteromonas luteoviolacea]KZN36255.1 hypothetical protein N475_17840 [Pseudoalteromonas luteoviolacea DSM 6061]MBE0386700.1 hypothetical protein [Pseudoalteromonas luteoviolacea DSM 6061]